MNDFIADDDYDFDEDDLDDEDFDNDDEDDEFNTTDDYGQKFEDGWKRTDGINSGYDYYDEFFKF
ncbi:MAG: hypothetical protein LBB10_02290 [Bifidobacteriaceae bacterium]|jgi:hypothetical protein|nr:hypothetical protein [Bifidobacteriaceae bacterium]